MQWMGLTASEWEANGNAGFATYDRWQGAPTVEDPVRPLASFGDRRSPPPRWRA